LSTDIQDIGVESDFSRFWKMNDAVPPFVRIPNPLDIDQSKLYKKILRALPSLLFSFALRELIKDE